MDEKGSGQNQRVRVSCESCGKEYRVSAKSIGKNAKCVCGHIFVVSAPKEQKGEQPESREAPAGSANDKGTKTSLPAGDAATQKAGRKMSGLAITSLVFGIMDCSTLVHLAVPYLSLVFVILAPFGLIGLVCGILALRRIRKSSGALGGKAIAIAGIALSSLAILLWSLVIVLAIIMAISYRPPA